MFSKNTYKRFKAKFAVPLNDPERISTVGKLVILHQTGDTDRWCLVKGKSSIRSSKGGNWEEYECDEYEEGEEDEEGIEGECQVLGQVFLDPWAEVPHQTPMLPSHTHQKVAFSDGCWDWCSLMLVTLESDTAPMSLGRMDDQGATFSSRSWTKRK